MKLILRAWLPDRKKMLHHDEISLTEGRVFERIYDPRTGMNSFARNNAVPMLWSMQKDSQEKLIFDGDILEYEFTEDSCWGKKGVYRGYVRFDKGCFEVVHLRDNIMRYSDSGWRKLSEFDDIKSLMGWSENVKKIGNVYEHPELLKVKP